MILLNINDINKDNNVFFILLMYLLMYFSTFPPPSPRCEKRPNHQYVLRSYSFVPQPAHRESPHQPANRSTAPYSDWGSPGPHPPAESGSFVLRLHQYSDAGCSDPFATFTARGQYGPLRPSWIVPGGTDLDYSLQR